MKISKLIATHHAILKQARLANLAEAYVTLLRCAGRVQRARLCGLVNLREPDAEEGRLWASLTALEGSQAVIDEHFCDEELMEFADAVAFVRGTNPLDLTFRIEALMVEFVEPLERELKRAGVEFDLEGEATSRPGDGLHSPASDRRGG